MLKKEPVAVSHVAGEDVVHVKAIHKAGTVVHQVHHLTTKLDPFVETHVEQTRIFVLREKQEWGSIFINLDVVIDAIIYV